MNKIIRATFGIMMILAALLALPVASAQAATLAANTQIINTATLTYNDGGTTKTSSATAVVLYGMVPTAVTIVPGSPPAPVPYTSTASLNNTFTLINNSNGKDSFTLLPAVTAQTNTSGAVASLVSPASPVVLGATITLAGSTASRLVVPYDGSIGSTATQINGLAPGDMITINGTTGYSIVAAGVTNAIGGSYIDFSPAYTVAGVATAVPAGTQVGEYVTVTVNVTAGSIVTATQEVQVSKTLRATSVANPGVTTLSAPMTDTFISGTAVLLKYVRNLNDLPGDATGNTAVYNGKTYYQRGVPAAPNDKLEYILKATNQAAAGGVTVTGASIADVLPVTYVTFLTGQYLGVTNVMYVNEAGVATYLTSGYTYNAGTGDFAISVGSLPGNTIAPAKSVSVLYQVQVKP